MKVSGFTIIRNAELMGYPIVESIRSLLPIVDEFVIGLGQSEDKTRELIESIGDPKIKIFDSQWDLSRISGGKILSEKTNEALARCENDWCFYLQGDEVIHEQDLSAIYKTMETYQKDPAVQGLLFKYIHFYGAFDVVATSRNWYRNEIRVIKKSSQAQSWNDAQGFRINGEKLWVRPSGGAVYHYGWVKAPKQMGQKKKLLDRLWHGNKFDSANDDFDFKKTYGLKRFKGTHPAVMRNRVAGQDWAFDPRKDLLKWTAQDLDFFANDVFERLFHFRIGEYKPYRLLRS